MRHTHRGTCQHCGRICAVGAESGEIANHGYRVAWGNHQGTCRGSGWSPLEESVNGAKLFAESYRARAMALRAKTEDDVNTVTVHEYVGGRFGTNRKPVYLHSDEEYQRWLEATPPDRRNTPTTWARLRAHVLAGWHHEATMLDAAATEIELRAERVFGQPLMEVR